MAIATAAVRDATNAQDLLDRLCLEAGLEVAVLDGDEEGRLGALAARASLQLREAVVVDLVKLLTDPITDIIAYSPRYLRHV